MTTASHLPARGPAPLPRVAVIERTTTSARSEADVADGRLVA
jgi:hypothetical protein